MRFIRFWLTLFALSLPLLGAAENVFAPPVVVVYPITATGPTSSDAGAQIAILLSTRLAQLGGLTVKPYTPGTTRADFLNAGLQQGADYYVTGYLTPVGGDVSFVAQVVSTHSGSIVYSSTQLVHTYGEAAAQAETLHDAILRHAGRGLASLDAPRPQPTVSPTPGSGAGIDISKALGRRKGRPAVSPQPSPSPAAASSAASVATAASIAGLAPHGTTALVLVTAGNGDDADRTYAASALSAALDRSGERSGVVALGLADVSARASDICRQNPGVTTFYAGTLGLDRAKRRGTSVAYGVDAYDCRAARIGRQRVVLPAESGSVRTTIDRAAADVVTALRGPATGATAQPSVQ